MTRKLDRTIRLALLVPFVAGMYVYGSTKRPRVEWDEGMAGGDSEIDTNSWNRVTFRWTYDAAIPPMTLVTFSAYAANASVEDVGEIGQAAIGLLHAEFVLPSAATNYLFVAEHGWAPSPTIVTNGVYHIPATSGRDGDKWVPLGTGGYSR